MGLHGLLAEDDVRGKFGVGVAAANQLECPAGLANTPTASRVAPRARTGGVALATLLTITSRASSMGQLVPARLEPDGKERAESQPRYPVVDRDHHEVGAFVGDGQAQECGVKRASAAGSAQSMTRWCRRPRMPRSCQLTLLIAYRRAVCEVSTPALFRWSSVSSDSPSS